MRALPRRWWVAWLAAVAIAATGCNTAIPRPSPETLKPIVTLVPIPTTSPPPSTTSTTAAPTFRLIGTVVTPDGTPLDDAPVSTNGSTAITGPDGAFDLGKHPTGPVTVTRPGWLPATLDWSGGDDPLVIRLEPRTVRALRAARDTAADDARFSNLLDLAEGSNVNALVFDTKDESGYVLYDSDVDEAHEIGSVSAVYDPVARLAAARSRGLYAITRIVTFEDAVWSRKRPDLTLSGRWLDVTNQETWSYPLALAEEACRIGFDEIQFDYVRFPAGRDGAALRADTASTEDERVAALAAFLAEARARLHALGCAISADIFAIVLSAPNDQGIGQRPEELSEVVDAISPMIYPSHYSDGWLGYANPNDFPAPVVANALDDGLPRLAGTALMRPWLQAFFYTADQVLAGIAEAESRGLGWMLWNAHGDYSEAWLPAPG